MPLPGRRREEPPPRAPRAPPAPEAEPESERFRDFQRRLGKFASGVSTKPLTDSEQRDHRDMIMATLQASFSGIDWFIAHTNRAHDLDVNIWSLDDEDAYALADAYLALGKRAGQVAYSVRMVGATYRYGAALAIPAQRLFETAQFYLRHGGFGW